MTIVTQSFDRDRNKNHKQKQQIVWMKKQLQKKPQLHCLRIFQINNANDHQDNLIDSECFDNVKLKYASKIGQFQDYSK